MIKRRSALGTRGLIGSLCILGMAACGDDTVYVRINVSDIPAGTVKIAIKSSVNGISYAEELFDISASDNTLVAGFKLPAATRGTFKADVEPRDQSGKPIKACDLFYSGSATRDIVSARDTILDVKLGFSAPDSGLASHLFAVWGTSKDDIWAVGKSGIIGRWNGCYWKKVLSPTSRSLSGIWGFRPDNIWAVGGDSFADGNVTIIKWDGALWTSQAPSPAIGGALTSIWGASETEMWAVGSNSNGIILKGNGTSNWTLYSETTFNTTTTDTEQFASIHGVDRSHVYAAGKGLYCMTGGGACRGQVAVFDGTAWRRYASATLNLVLSRVYAESPSKIWFGGRDGFLASWDGTVTGGTTLGGVNVVGKPMTGQLMQGLFGFPSAPQDAMGPYYSLYTAGQPSTFFKVGTTGAVQLAPAGDPIDRQFTNLFGKTPDDLWLVGYDGGRFHYDGTSLKRYASPQ